MPRFGAIEEVKHPSEYEGSVHKYMWRNGPCGAAQVVTVTDVKIHQSDNASASDSGWLDLAPALKDNPVQVDLLGVANQCFLAMLGSAEIEAGHYQQIRVILADNSVSVNGNKCGSTANCLMLTSDPRTPRNPCSFHRSRTQESRFRQDKLPAETSPSVREKPRT